MRKERTVSWVPGLMSVSIAVAMGCATTGGGASPEEPASASTSSSPATTYEPMTFKRLNDLKPKSGNIEITVTLGGTNSGGGELYDCKNMIYQFLLPPDTKAVFSASAIYLATPKDKYGMIENFSGGDLLKIRGVLTMKMGEGCSTAHEAVRYIWPRAIEKVGRNEPNPALPFAPPR